MALPWAGHTTNDLQFSGEANKFSSLVDNNGFDVIYPPKIGRYVYVSSSEGSDSNDGLTAQNPVQTVDYANSLLTRGHDDRLLFKAGDTFNEAVTVNVSEGVDKFNPQCVGVYGQGSRPEFHASMFTEMFKFKNDNTLVQGLKFRQFEKDPNDPAYDSSADSVYCVIRTFSGEPHKNIKFQDCEFLYTELSLRGLEGDPLDQIFINRCIVSRVWIAGNILNSENRISNIYASYTNNLSITECTIDHGGWNEYIENAGASQFSHNIYVQFECGIGSVFISDNILTRASSHGAQLRSAGVANNNFVGRSAIGILQGYSKFEDVTGSIYGFRNIESYAYNNVVSETYSQVKGNPAPNAFTNMATRAAWGIDFDQTKDFDRKAFNNILSGQYEKDTLCETLGYGTLIRGSRIGVWDHELYQGFRTVYEVGTATYKLERDDEGVGYGYPDPDISLSTYYQKLVNDGDILPQPSTIVRGVSALDPEAFPYIAAPGGTVYFGEPSLDPESNPKTIYSDYELTQSVSSSQALDVDSFMTQEVYIDGNFSVRVKDSSNQLVWEDLNYSKDGFDKFIQLAVRRERGEWPEYMAADAINNYFRNGYNLSYQRVQIIE